MTTYIKYSPKYDTLSDEETTLLEEAANTSANVVRHSAQLNGKTTRNFHAKAYAGIRGVFKLNESHLSNLHIPNDCNVLVRFSNASSFINQDKKDMPAYGFSLRLENSEGFTANFPLANFPVFVTSNCEKFLKLVIAVNNFIVESAEKKLPVPEIGDLMAKFSSLIIDKDFFKMFSVIKNAFTLNKEFVLNYTYHSIGCYRFDDKMCKLRVVPQAQFNIETDKITQEDALRSILETNELKFDLQIQFAEDEEKQPINDLLIEWPEDCFFSLGTLVFPMQEILGSDNKELEAMDFSPFNNPPELQPVGKIQRTRNLIYKASYEARTKN